MVEETGCDFVAGRGTNSQGDSRQIAKVLERRLATVEEKFRQLQALYEEHTPIVSRAVLHRMLGTLEHCKTEFAWLKRLAKDAREDRLKERGVPIDAEDA
jgi:hypothetical protein